MKEVPDMRIVEDNGVRIAVLDGDHGVLRDELAVLDLIGDLISGQNADQLVIPESVLPPSFFNLNSGVAGKLLQKFVNYRVRVAIVGNFSKYASQTLRQFMRESNKTGQVYFTATNEEALARLLA